MAAQLRQYAGRITTGAWTKIMGQGIDGALPTDEHVFDAQIQNLGTEEADLLVAFVDGDSAPGSDTANGVLLIADLPPKAIQPIARKALSAGWTCWVKSANDIQVEAVARFSATV